MLQSSSRQKWKKCKQTLPCTTEDHVMDCSSLPASSSLWSSNQGLQSFILVEALLRLYHLDVQGLVHQQLLSSAMIQHCSLLPVYRVVVLPCMLHYSWLFCHPPLTGITVFRQSRFQSPFGLPNVDLAAVAGDTIYYIELLLSRGSVSLALVNIKQRVCPDLKTTLMLNFLQTCLMSLVIPAT